jgi:hypothetical protein
MIALIPFCLIWIFIFYRRKDLRNEMLFMSVLMSGLCLFSTYYGWTVDWWYPQNITNSLVGIEDFILGFTSGGIMATIYELLFKRSMYKRKLHHHISGALTILFLLMMVTMYLFWGVGLTSFWSSTIAMIIAAIILMIVRKDLVFNSLLTGILMVLVSLSFYFVILVISPEWIDKTYLAGISGIRIIGIPVEEFVFWFLAGAIFGPFYEYWQGEKLKVLRST